MSIFNFGRKKEQFPRAETQETEPENEKREQLKKAGFKATTSFLTLLMLGGAFEKIFPSAQADKKDLDDSQKKEEVDKRRLEIGEIEAIEKEVQQAESVEDLVEVARKYANTYWLCGQSIESGSTVFSDEVYDKYREDEEMLTKIADALANSGIKNIRSLSFVWLHQTR